MFDRQVRGRIRHSEQGGMGGAGPGVEEQVQVRGKERDSGLPHRTGALRRQGRVYGGPAEDTEVKHEPRTGRHSVQFPGWWGRLGVRREGVANCLPGSQEVQHHPFELFDRVHRRLLPDGAVICDDVVGHEGHRYGCRQRHHDAEVRHRDLQKGLLRRRATKSKVV